MLNFVNIFSKVVDNKIYAYTLYSFILLFIIYIFICGYEKKVGGEYTNDMELLKNTFSNKAFCSPTPTLSFPYSPSLSPFLTLPPYLPSLPSLSFSLPSP